MVNYNFKFISEINRLRVFVNLVSNPVVGVGTSVDNKNEKSRISDVKLNTKVSSDPIQSFTRVKTHVRKVASVRPLGQILALEERRH